MASVLSLIVMTLFLVITNGEDLQVGSSENMSLAYQEQVKLANIPMKTRTKNVFFTHETGKVIKGVLAIDIDKSEAKATITSGGVGSTYVNVKLKSGRGDGLNYNVQIYV